MTNGEQRLERTENDLEIVKQLLLSTARAVESNREDISQLTNKLDRLTVNVDQLTGRVDHLAENLNASIQDLTGIMVQFARDAEADRALIRENQTEIRRIWEYLMRQSGNGHQQP